MVAESSTKGGKHMMDSKEKLLTIKEVLELASVSRHTLYRDIKSGKIPAIYLGKNVRIKEKDAVEYAKKKANSKSVQFYKKKDDD